MGRPQDSSGQAAISAAAIKTETSAEFGARAAVGLWFVVRLQPPVGNTLISCCVTTNFMVPIEADGGLKPAAGTLATQLPGVG
jgi:hypothetical protein